MAEVKGKFISLAGYLMSAYEEAFNPANERLFKATGKYHKDLEPEGWYDTAIFNDFMLAYASASSTHEQAIVTLGKNVYSTIKKTTGLPPNIKMPLDLLLYEGEGFLLNHRGADVVPRIFKTKTDGHVVVRAPAPGYSQKLYEGVYLGILEMFGVKSGKVTMTKGSPDFEYDITW